MDDDPAILENLRHALDWAEYGFANIYTASNAVEALRLLNTAKITLLISDIMMPGMTGLEMLRKVRSQYPDTHCVLISAHGEFEYAREALKMGVENYLLKPIDMQDLQETVLHTVENLQRTGRITNDLYENNILERWLYGRIAADELIEHSKYTRLNVLMRRYRILVLRQAGNVESLLRNIASSLGIDYWTHGLNIDDYTDILLIGGREVDEEVVREAVCDSVRQHPGVIAACGSLAFGNGEVSQSLDDAFHALAYAAHANIDGWIAFDDIDWKLIPDPYVANLESIVCASSRSVDPWVNALLSIVGSTPEIIRAVYAHACLLLPRLRRQAMPAGQNAVCPPFLPPYTASRLAALLSQAIDAVSKSIQMNTSNRSPITHRIEKYIHDNLSGDITIKQFAEQIHMDATHIGRIFKNDTGMFFSDYVRHQRISRAKKLLETTDLSVSSIAQQVGIYDASYFTQCFKKQERISPMKYRQAFHGEKR